MQVSSPGWKLYSYPLRGQTTKDSPRPMFRESREEEERNSRGRGGIQDSSVAQQPGEECFRKNGRGGAQQIQRLPSHPPKKARQRQ